MADPFLSEIRIFSFNFPPKSWAFCNGQLLPINQNQPLFALLGTTFGGNGQTNFALPDLRDRVPMHFNNHDRGEKGGQPAHTLTMNEMTAHMHFLMVTNNPATATAPDPNVIISASPSNAYGAAGNLVAMADTVGHTGGSQPHQNMQPYLGLNFCIALQGIFPSQN